MSAVSSVRGALKLLSVRDRWKLALVTLFQMSTSILDLIGVVLVGLFGALAVASAQEQPAPPLLNSFSGLLGLESLSEQQWLLLIASLAVVALLSKSLLSATLLRRTFLFLASREAAVSNRLAALLLQQPLTYVQRRSSQETFYALVPGCTSATLVILGQGVIVASEAMLLLLLGVTLLAVNPVTALGSVTFFGLVAVSLHFALGRWATSSGNVSATTAVASQEAIQEVLSGYREVFVADRRDAYLHRFQSLRWRAAKASADLQFISTFPKYIFEVALVVGSIVLAWVLFSTEDTVVAVGTLGLFLAAATRIMPSILRLQSALLAIKHAAAMAERTFGLASELAVRAITSKRGENSIHSILPTKPDCHFSPGLILSNVTFHYGASPLPAIDSLSLTIAPGESLAVVGRSGAGKSTLADMMLGLLEPSAGEITLGGVAPSSAVAYWPGSIAYVPQSVTLTNSTIRDNVGFALAREDIDDSLVWSALERAHLADVVRSLEGDLDARVGEAGARLSGGQRQRLGIARALYSKPTFMVLDEATSALDSETEAALTQTMSDLRGQVTTVIIAHRLSTIESVDRVAYLENGRLLALDSFDAVCKVIPAFEKQVSLIGTFGEHS